MSRAYLYLEKESREEREQNRDFVILFGRKMHQIASVAI